MMEDKITKMEAFLAMKEFLNSYYKMTKSDDVGALLGAMEILEDGETADPAIWEDWEDSLNKIIKKKL